MATSIKQIKHLKKLAILNRGRKMSEKQKESIRNSVRKFHEPIVKICLNCGKQFFRNRYSCGIEEPWPKYADRKYCSLYCARHSDQFKKRLRENTGGGSKNRNWKGGRNMRDGYVQIWSPYHPFSNKGYVQEHRLVMEKKLHRFLKPTEVIHHINEIKTDNRIENLMLFKNTGFHLSHHLRLKKSLT